MIGALIRRAEDTERNKEKGRVMMAEMKHSYNLGNSKDYWQPPAGRRQVWKTCQCLRKELNLPRP